MNDLNNNDILKNYKKSLNDFKNIGNPTSKLNLQKDMENYNEKVSDTNVQNENACSYYTKNDEHEIFTNKNNFNIDSFLVDISLCDSTTCDRNKFKNIINKKEQKSEKDKLYDSLFNVHQDKLKVKSNFIINNSIVNYDINLNNSLNRISKINFMQKFRRNARNYHSNTRRERRMNVLERINQGNSDTVVTTKFSTTSSNNKQKLKSLYNFKVDFESTHSYQAKENDKNDRPLENNTYFNNSKNSYKNNMDKIEKTKENKLNSNLPKDNENKRKKKHISDNINSVDIKYPTILNSKNNFPFYFNYSGISENFKSLNNVQMSNNSNYVKTSYDQIKKIILEDMPSDSNTWEGNNISPTAKNELIFEVNKEKEYFNISSYLNKPIQVTTDNDQKTKMVEAQKKEDLVNKNKKNNSKTSFAYLTNGCKEQKQYLQNLEKFNDHLKNYSLEEANIHIKNYNLRHSFDFDRNGKSTINDNSIKNKYLKKKAEKSNTKLNMYESFLDFEKEFKNKKNLENLIKKKSEKNTELFLKFSGNEKKNILHYVTKNNNSLKCTYKEYKKSGIFQPVSLGKINNVSKNQAIREESSNVINIPINFKLKKKLKNCKNNDNTHNESVKTKQNDIFPLLNGYYTNFSNTQELKNYKYSFFNKSEIYETNGLVIPFLKKDIMNEKNMHVENLFSLNDDFNSNIDGTLGIYSTKCNKNEEKKVILKNNNVTYDKEHKNSYIRMQNAHNDNANISTGISMLHKNIFHRQEIHQQIIGLQTENSTQETQSERKEIHSEYNNYNFNKSEKCVVYNTKGSNSEEYCHKVKNEQNLVIHNLNLVINGEDKHKKVEHDDCLNDIIFERENKTNADMTSKNKSSKNGDEKTAESTYLSNQWENFHCIFSRDPNNEFALIKNTENYNDHNNSFDSVNRNGKDNTPGSMHGEDFYGNINDIIKEGECNTNISQIKDEICSAKYCNNEQNDCVNNENKCTNGKYRTSNETEKKENVSVQTGGELVQKTEVKDVLINTESDVNILEYNTKNNINIKEGDNKNFNEKIKSEINSNELKNVNYNIGMKNEKNGIYNETPNNHVEIMSEDAKDGDAEYQTDEKHMKNQNNSNKIECLKDEVKSENENSHSRNIYNICEIDDKCTKETTYAGNEKKESKENEFIIYNENVKSSYNYNKCKSDFDREVEKNYQNEQEKHRNIYEKREHENRICRKEIQVESKIYGEEEKGSKVYNENNHIDNYTQVSQNKKNEHKYEKDGTLNSVDTRIAVNEDILYESREHENQNDIEKNEQITIENDNINSEMVTENGNKNGNKNGESTTKRTNKICEITEDNVNKSIGIMNKTFGKSFKYKSPDENYDFNKNTGDKNISDVQKASCVNKSDNMYSERNLDEKIFLTINERFKSDNLEQSNEEIENLIQENDLDKYSHNTKCLNNYSNSTNEAYTFPTNEYSEKKNNISKEKVELYKLLENSSFENINKIETMNEELEEEIPYKSNRLKEEKTNSENHKSNKDSHSKHNSYIEINEISSNEIIKEFNCLYIKINKYNLFKYLNINEERLNYINSLYDSFDYLNKTIKIENDNRHENKIYHSYKNETDIIKSDIYKKCFEEKMNNIFNSKLQENHDVNIYSDISIFDGKDITHENRNHFHDKSRSINGELQEKINDTINTNKSVDSNISNKKLQNDLINCSDLNFCQRINLETQEKQRVHSDMGNLSSSDENENNDNEDNICYEDIKRNVWLQNTDLHKKMKRKNIVKYIQLESVKCILLFCYLYSVKYFQGLHDMVISLFYLNLEPYEIFCVFEKILHYYAPYLYLGNKSKCISPLNDVKLGKYMDNYNLSDITIDICNYNGRLFKLLFQFFFPRVSHYFDTTVNHTWPSFLFINLNFSKFNNVFCLLYTWLRLIEIKDEGNEVSCDFILYLLSFFMYKLKIIKNKFYKKGNLHKINNTTKYSSFECFKKNEREAQIVAQINASIPKVYLDAENQKRLEYIEEQIANKKEEKIANEEEDKKKDKVSEENKDKDSDKNEEKDSDKNEEKDSDKNEEKDSDKNEDKESDKNEDKESERNEDKKTDEIEDIEADKGCEESVQIHITEKEHSMNLYKESKEREKDEKTKREDIRKRKLSKYCTDMFSFFFECNSSFDEHFCDNYEMHIDQIMENIKKIKEMIPISIMDFIISYNSKYQKNEHLADSEGYIKNEKLSNNLMKYIDDNICLHIKISDLLYIHNNGNSYEFVFIRLLNQKIVLSKLKFISSSKLGIEDFVHFKNIHEFLSYKKKLRSTLNGHKKILYIIIHHTDEKDIQLDDNDINPCNKSPHTNKTNTSANEKNVVNKKIYMNMIFFKRKNKENNKICENLNDPMLDKNPLHSFIITVLKNNFKHLTILQDHSCVIKIINEKKSVAVETNDNNSLRENSFFFQMFNKVKNKIYENIAKDNAAKKDNSLKINFLQNNLKFSLKNSNFKMFSDRKIKKRTNFKNKQKIIIYSKSILRKKKSEKPKNRLNNKLENTLLNKVEYKLNRRMPFALRKYIESNTVVLLNNFKENNGKTNDNFKLSKKNNIDAINNNSNIKNNFVFKEGKKLKLTTNAYGHDIMYSHFKKKRREQKLKKTIFAVSKRRETNLIKIKIPSDITPNKKTNSYHQKNYTTRTLRDYYNHKKNVILINNTHIDKYINQNERKRLNKEKKIIFLQFQEHFLSNMLSEKLSKDKNKESYENKYVQTKINTNAFCTKLSKVSDLNKILNK
ncbi:conserved Plasmodium protein, unknown function [Plasmodium malariae]|uniref:Uncharacterized protein n=1 Tax=Plasmodium malariae TaxID=5858 RepID=A0A1D3RHC0_PLAMA|nr:conserved Plasmodium protein, unknown function [Plasmodium malariae]SCN44571.1 conserved Plasmodium protein, unknown function [Plasmodium malariae]